MADEKIDLPDGGWALIRDPRRVTEKQRRPYVRLQERLMASSLGELLMEKQRKERAGEPPEKVDEWFGEQVRPLMGTEDYELSDLANNALALALVERVLVNGEEIVVSSADDLANLPAPAFDAIRRETAKHITALLPNFGPTAEDPTPPSAD